MAFKVTVEQEKCKGCEECLEVCTVQVFEMQNRKAVPLRGDQCFGCETCIGVCKEKAISIENMEMELSETARSLLQNILYD